MKNRLWLSLSTGVLSGAMVGSIEALIVLTSSGAGEYDALFWGTMVYSLCGLCLGLLIFPLWGFISQKYLPNLSTLWSALFVLQSLIVQSIASFGGWQWVWMWLWVLIAPIGIWLGDIILRRSPLKILPTRKGTFTMFGVLLLVTSVFSLTPSRRLPPITPSPQSQPLHNILFLVVDGLRADHLQLGITPSIDRLIKDSIYFDHAFSHAPVSAPSMASILGSETNIHSAPLESKHELISEKLLESGYQTGAVVNHISMGRFSNFHQGFTHFRFLPPASPIPFTEGTRRLRLIERLLAWWSTKGEPRPDKMYRPAQDVMRQVQNQIQHNREGPWFVIGHLRDTQEPLFVQGANGKFHPPIWVQKHNAPDIYRAYVSELRRVDDALKSLISWMRQSNIYDSSMIVLTASHATALKSGQALGPSPHRERLQVPLIMKLPYSQGGGEQQSGPIQLVDLSPTVLSYLGLDIPSRWEGEDVLSPQFKENKEPRPIFASYQAPLSGWSMVQHKGWKFIRHHGALNDEELYNLRIDPDERENLASRNSTEYVRLSRLLRDLEKR
jgi:arylsulfatase A-like enzyme